MTWGDAFLLQAQADWRANRRMGAEGWPVHDRLHYLQMACEKLAKSVTWQGPGEPPHNHRAFVAMLRVLRTHSGLAAVMGYESATGWREFVEGLRPAADMIERLAPALTENEPNPEYPWPLHPGDDSSVLAPCTHDWSPWLPASDPKMAQLDRLLCKMFEQHGRIFA